MTSVNSKIWVEARLRHADLTDVSAIERLVHSAYEKYVSRIGRKPKPMLANYEQAVTNHQTWVVTN